VLIVTVAISTGPLIRLAHTSESGTGRPITSERPPTTRVDGRSPADASHRCCSLIIRTTRAPRECTPRDVLR
jgi:hypothetical protein